MECLRCGEFEILDLAGETVSLGSKIGDRLLRFVELRGVIAQRRLGRGPGSDAFAILPVALDRLRRFAYAAVRLLPRGIGPAALPICIKRSPVRACRLQLFVQIDTFPFQKGLSFLAPGSHDGVLSFLRRSKSLRRPALGSFVRCKLLSCALQPRFGVCAALLPCLPLLLLRLGFLGRLPLVVGVAPQLVQVAGDPGETCQERRSVLRHLAGR